ncbi:MAG TPA: choice-of-anchor tandem repeat GloVer-containing protein, partial [Bacteroidia bacterium]|nr:choice-of-anchor tandem repeat GloVer-containing protein [Bacteroidia bacterium]
MTYSGGEYSAGVIFKTDNMGDNYVVEHSFFRIESANPQYTGLIQAKDGNLYGMTCYGGSNSKGDIFCYNPATNSYTNKIDFDGDTNGAFPYGSLLEASDGMLYGLTSRGGANNKGVLFQYNTSTSTYIKKFDFDSISGSSPYGSLIQTTDGMLYGMTYSGGANNMGIIFQYNPVTSMITKKFDFNDSISGGKPTGSLLQAKDGMLYGMTNGGGINDLGIIFQYNPVTSTVVKKLDFNGNVNGSNPYGSLMQANDSMLYGVTHSGGSYNMGVLFQYNPSTSAYTKKEDFNGAAIGNNPYGSLMQAANGKLYGITRFGGTFNYGVIFQYDIQASSCINLFDFDGLASGRNSYGSLIQADDGKLYGMTYSGGESGVYGTLFQYNLDEDYFTKKLDFGAPNGKNPFGSLTAANDGMFYGMTYSGGVNGTGVFFQYNPITSVYTKKFDFSKMLLGSRPTGTLLQAMDGMLYGLTSDGGTYNMGIIFSYNPTNSSFLKEADLDNVTGYWPYGSLIQADDSMLYGITSTGGSHEAGALFQYNPFTHTCSNKFDFDDTITGKNPYGSLMQASDGMLYGMTSTGGAKDKGVLFQYNPHTDVCLKKIDFDSINGSNPYEALVQADNGMLYGMTTAGGDNNMGIIFQYNPITSILKKVHDFDGLT